MSNRHRVLFVDDEPRILESIKRVVRGDFDVDTALGAALGMAMVKAAGPYAVVVSDLRMPGVDGIAFLSAVRRVSPDCVRILLTGYADLDAAIKAVNDGQVFRFLKKPCSPAAMLQVLTAAFAQFDLIIAERELLEGTLQGSITALSEVLALISPLAFARAVRVKACVGAFAERYDIPNRWQFEVAALLSQLGAASLPKELAEKIYFGQELSQEERAQALEIPLSAAQIVSHVPRLDAVREILAHQHRDFSAPNRDAPGPWGLDIPLGARLLRVAFDFDVLVSQGLSIRDALIRLAKRIGTYDPDVLQDFVSWQREDLLTRRTRELTLGELRVGMMLAVDVVTEHGVLLIARGQLVTSRVMDLIHKYWVSQPIRGQVHVFLTEEFAAVGSPTAAEGKLATASA